MGTFVRWILMPLVVGILLLRWLNFGLIRLGDNYCPHCADGYEDAGTMLILATILWLLLLLLLLLASHYLPRWLTDGAAQSDDDPDGRSSGRDE
jgi:uncharacterized protein involved in cysteine biosynthesis